MYVCRCVYVCLFVIVFYIIIFSVTCNNHNISTHVCNLLQTPHGDTGQGRIHYNCDFIYYYYYLTDLFT